MLVSKKIDPEKLKAYIEKHPDAYQTEMPQEFKCTPSAICKALKRLNITRKKKVKSYSEQDDEKVAEYIEKINYIPEKKQVYLDEMGIHTPIFREYGYAPKGKEVLGKVSGRHFKKTNIVAALIENRPIAPML